MTPTDTTFTNSFCLGLLNEIFTGRNDTVTKNTKPVHVHKILLACINSYENEKKTCAFEIIHSMRKQSTSAFIPLPKQVMLYTKSITESENIYLKKFHFVLI